MATPFESITTSTNARRYRYIHEYKDMFDYTEQCLHHQLRSDLHDLGLINVKHLPMSYLDQHLQPHYDQFISRLPPTCGYVLLSRNAQRFEAMLRVSVPEFYMLYLELEPFIMQARSVYMYDDAATEGEQYRPSVLHPVDQLCVWLFRADDNDANLLGVLFNDVHRTTIDRIMDHVSGAIIAAWSDETEWPDAEERQMLYGRFSLYEKTIACLDGTHCRIQVPLDPEEEVQYFSGYKKYHTQNYLIAANALSLIVYIDGPHPGRDNDRGAFNKSVFVTNASNMLSEGEVILTDGGFIGDGPHLFPFTQAALDAAPTQQERDNMTEYNQVLTMNRSMIEHCIHKVKNRAQSLASRFSRSKHIQVDLVQAAARLYNRTQRMRMQYSLDQQQHSKQQ